MKKETSNSVLEYYDKIMYVRVKEDVQLTIPSMQEQYDSQLEMVGEDIYAVLVDGTKFTIVPHETREFMAEYNPPNRVATAIISNQNLAMIMMINFYLKVNQPKLPTKLFKDELKGVAWLKDKLKDRTDF